MALAKAPTRGDKVQIAFGLLNIPVTIFNAFDAEAGKVITRRQYGPSNTPIRYNKVEEGTGEVVTNDQIKMMATASDGTVVELTDEEMQEFLAAKGDSELLCIYPFAEAEKYHVVGELQVRPQTVKVGSRTTHPYDKAFMLFLVALEREESFALLQYATRGSVKVACIYPDGSATQIAYEEVVRETLPLPEVELDEKNIGMALRLVKTIKAKKAPASFTNDSRQKIHDYVEAKAKSGEKPELGTAPAPVAVDDLMAVLEASVKAAKDSK